MSRLNSSRWRAAGIPFQRTSPCAGVSRPQSMRSRLVLPLPLAPPTCSSRPLPRDRLRPENSVRSPRVHSRCCASSMVAVLEVRGATANCNTPGVGSPLVYSAIRLPPMRFPLFLAFAAIGALATPAVPAQPAPDRGAAAASEPSPAEVLRDLRRTATDPMQNDAGMTSFTDCGHQRNLVDKGRHDAQMIGGSIRALAIPVEKVLASPYCRTVETAELAFGRIEKLNEVRYNGPVQPGEDRYVDMRKLIATRPK